MKLIRNQKGSVAVIVGLAMTMLLGFSAIVIDVGALYLNRVQLNNMVDAAALAGAREFLPDAGGSPVSMAQAYAALNGRKAGDSVIIDTSNMRITVSATRQVDLFFARIFGMNSSQVTASATATAGAIRSAKGLAPFGIEKQTFVYGDTYVLKSGGGSGDTGNYGALALGGNGAKVYEYNIINGYNGTLNIGDKVSTETGNMSGPTSDGISQRIAGTSSAFPPADVNTPRIITIPVIETMDVNGKKEVTIVGFANFFLEDAGGSGNDSWVSGKFMKIPRPGEITTNAGNFYGMYNVRLIDPAAS